MWGKMSLKDNFISLLSQLAPQEVAASASPFNRKISIRKNFGKNELFVDDIRQSGGMIDELWKNAFKKIDPAIIKKAKNFIVFGIGGASVMYWIRHYNPTAVIDAVDIDEEILNISRKYFNLDNYKVSKIYCEDAQDFTGKHKRNLYDFIVIDLYIGNHVPDFVSSDKFLKGIKTIMAPEGKILINYFDDTGKNGEKKLEKQLNQIFSQVTAFRVFANTMFLAG